MLKDLIAWSQAWAHSEHSLIALFIFSFIESIFFPIPPDILLITMCCLAPQRNLLFASICSLASVSGGCIGYIIGLKGGLPLLKKFIKQETLNKVHNLFQKYEGWAILIAAFTPIPYKVFTLSAGLFYVNFKIFVLASTIGRTGRFFLISIAITIFGKSIKEVIFKYFDVFSILLVLLIILGFIGLKYMLKFGKK